MNSIARQHERSDATRVFIDVDQPFSLTEPVEQTVPIVVASPHSGSRYPSDLLAATKLDPLSLRQSEDAYVDALFGGATKLGAPMLAAEFPRAYVDVNREPRGVCGLCLERRGLCQGCQSERRWGVHFSDSLR